MSQLLNRFSLTTAQWNTQIAVCLLLLWIAIVVCAHSSIRAQGFSDSHRRFWLFIVTAVPILGLLAYLPFSFRREDMPQHFLSKPKDRNRNASPRRRSVNITTVDEA